MTKYLILARAFAGAGCGSGSGSTSIHGDWLRSSGPMVVGLTFEPDGKYAVRKMQIVTPTAVNHQLETGTAFVDSSAFTLTPLEWSCPEPSKPSHYAYSLDGDTLSIAGTLYARNDAAPDAGIVVTVGCFAEDGSFSAHPLSGEEP